MSTLTIPVPIRQFRRRSLSGDRDFNFKRKKMPDSLEHLSVLSKLISRLHLRKAVLVLLGSLMVFLYFCVCLSFTLRQRITRNDDNEPDLDVCSMTAKSANIFNDLKQTITTGSLGALSHHRSNDRVWREHLLQSFELNENLKKNPFENITYPTEGDMLEILQKHKDGKTSDKDIINDYPFSSILTPSEQCGEMPNTEQNVYLLFIIKSSLSHFKLRNAIRNTWANSTFTNGYTIKRAFLLGQSNDNEAVESALKSESTLYGDILQMDFIESHRNSTWKLRGGLKWASENCSGAKYVMLVDDNQYVATDMVIQLLEFMGKLDNLYMGWVNWRPAPFRSKVSKWYVSREEYPYPLYPAVVSTSAVLMSMDFVMKVNIASMYTKHFLFDDVFLAIVANKLHISPISNKLFYRANIPYINNLFETTLACHGYYTPSGLYHAWMVHLLIRCYGHNILNHFLMKTGNRRSQHPIRF